MAQAMAANSVSFQSPTTSASSVSFQSPTTLASTAMTSSAGRLFNFIKNAAGALLPSVVLSRSPSPSTSSFRTSPKTNRLQADEPHALNQSQYVHV